MQNYINSSMNKNVNYDIELRVRKVGGSGMPSLGDDEMRKCKVYKNYCTSASHNGDCHSIMESYYGQWFYGKRYFICPTCKTLGMEDYLNFYKTHRDHLTSFTQKKKQLLKSILDRMSNRQLDVASKRIKLEIREIITIKNEAVEVILNEDNEEEIKMEPKEAVINETEEEANNNEQDITLEDWNNFEIINELDKEDIILQKFIDEVDEEDIILQKFIDEVDEEDILQKFIDAEENILVGGALNSNRAIQLSDNFFEEGIKQLNEKIAIKNELGSSWILRRILEVNSKITKFQNISRLSGYDYIPTPTNLKNKNAIVNIQNKDNKSFIYSILVILKKDKVKNQRYRASKYKKYMPELVFDEEDMPMKLFDITKFEMKNPGLSINVLSWKSNDVENGGEEKVFKHPHVDIIHKSIVDGEKKICLLLLEDENKYHYTAVMNLNRLMNRRNKGASKRIQSKWCSNCLNGFNKKAFEKHVAICVNKSDRHNSIYYTKSEN